MAARTQIWCLLFMCLAAVAAGRLIAQQEGCSNLNVKKASYLSPPLTAMPGEANNKYFPAIFPKGHIGIKSLNADLVYADGSPVPLSEIYLHHWLLIESAVPKGKVQQHMPHLLRKMKRHHHHHGYVHDDHFEGAEEQQHHHRHHRFHAGGERSKFVNFFGKGGETRHTESRFPGQYVIESGAPPEGYETVWVMNIHGLDTRGALNEEGCAECRCNLYNATTDEDGKALPEGYIGGLLCCGDGNQCALKEGFNGGKNTFHLRYEWEYMDWNECLVPTSGLGIDVAEGNVEFTVEGCSSDADPASEECLDRREATRIAPVGGEVVYTVSHVHASTLDAAVYGEDGRLICQTTPIYGTGEEAGNEKNHVVGIKTCYGNPGTPNAARIEKGEKLRFVVTSTKVGGPHTGLMGLNLIRIAADGEKADM